MKRTTRNAAKTKQEIIEKSAPIFNIHGYAGTKMQMLTEATGYQMGGIYRHFPTKMDLAKAAFAYNYETLIKRSITVSDELNPKEKLLAIIDNYQRMVAKPVIPGGCPILNTITEMDDTDEVFREQAKVYVEEILNTIRTIIEEGQEKGIFKSSLDAQQEALHFLASFEGAILVAKVMKRMQPLRSVFQHTMNYLERHLCI